MGTVSWGVKMGCMARSHLRTKDKWGTAAALFCAGYVLSCFRGLIGKTHEQRVLRSAHGFPASSFSNAVYLGYHYSTYRSTNVEGRKALLGFDSASICWVLFTSIVIFFCFVLTFTHL